MPGRPPVSGGSGDGGRRPLPVTAALQPIPGGAPQCQAASLGYTGRLAAACAAFGPVQGVVKEHWGARRGRGQPARAWGGLSGATRQRSFYLGPRGALTAWWPVTWQPSDMPSGIVGCCHRFHSLWTGPQVGSQGRRGLAGLRPASSALCSLEKPSVAAPACQKQPIVHIQTPVVSWPPAKRAILL
jgi:hypothetical protein